MGRLDIDVEKIIMEIREEASKIEDLETIDFEDISVPRNVWNMPRVNERVHFNWDSFLYELENANKFVHVPFSAPALKENFLKAVIRKLAVKFTRFYLKTIVERQNTYNANSVRSLNEIGNFIRDMDIMSGRQNEINERLEMDIQNMNINFNKEYKKRLDVYERQNRYLKEELDKMKKRIEALSDGEIHI